jgi:hypothetical protein
MYFVNTISMSLCVIELQSSNVQSGYGTSHKLKLSFSLFLHVRLLVSSCSSDNEQEGPTTLLSQPKEKRT